MYKNIKRNILLLLVFFGVVLILSNFFTPHSGNIVPTIDNYISSIKTPEPAIDVSDAIGKLIFIGQSEVDARNALVESGFNEVSEKKDRYFWNFPDDSGSQEYMAFQLDRNVMIITSRTYIVEIGIRNGLVSWEHAAVIGHSL